VVAAVVGAVVVAAVMAADAEAMVAVAADVAVMAAAVADAAEIVVVVATAAIAETAGSRLSSFSLTLSSGATLIPAGRKSTFPKVKRGTPVPKIHSQKLSRIFRW
jgi:hypothetical protein